MDWTKQPPGVAGPNRSNSMGKDLKFLWSGVLPSNELALKKAYNTGTSVVTDVGPTTDGQALRGDGTTQTQLIKFDSQSGHLSGTNTNQLTVGLRFRLKNLNDTTQRRWFSKFQSGSQGWFFRKREESGNGTLELFLVNSSTISLDCISPRFTDTTKFQNLVATYDGVTARLYIDGKLVDSATFSSGGDVLGDLGEDIALMGTDGEGSQESSIDISMAFGSHRAFTPGEIASLTQDPWQLFAPKPQYALADVPETEVMLPVKNNLDGHREAYFPWSTYTDALSIAVNGWERKTGSILAETDTTYGVATPATTAVVYKYMQPLSSEDMWCEVTIPAVDDVGSSFSAAGPAVRMQENGACYYLRQNDSGNINLERVDNLAAFKWGINYAHSPTVGDVLRLEAITAGGTVILRGYLNGMLIIETAESHVNDADAISPLRGNHAGFYYIQGSDQHIGLDNWSAGALATEQFLAFPVQLPDAAEETPIDRRMLKFDRKWTRKP